MFEVLCENCGWTGSELELQDGKECPKCHSIAAIRILDSLVQCPFKHDKDSLRVNYSIEEDFYYVECEICHTKGPTASSIIESGHKWNKRS